jgi:hypothetical protein
MQRHAAIESLEARQLFAVTGGLTSPTTSPITLAQPSITVPAKTGTVRPGDTVGFDPQPDPPGLPFMPTISR